MIKAGIPAGLLPALTKPVKPVRADLAFLPAALEILETPPSPVRMALISIIGGLVAVALIWSYCSQIDIFAVATGKIRPTMQIKTIEPLEPGRVRRVAVADGTHVKAGDVLLELDATESSAESAGAASNLVSVRAEVLRRQSAVAAAEDGSEADLPTIDWPASIPTDIRAREMRVLRHDLGGLQAAIRGLKMQEIEKAAERDRLRATIGAETALIATLQERVDMRASLVKTGSGTRAALIDAMQTLQSQQSTLAGDRGWLAEALAALTTLSAGEEKTREGFISDNAQKLADAERQAAENTQRAIKAKAAMDHMTLTSPVDGTVQSLSITSLAQVVTSGQQVMRIVPDNAPLEIEAYLNNRDVGFVEAGQEAVVKIDSIPFTRYGTIRGRVVRVGLDSIPAQDAQRSQSDPTRIAPPRSIDGAGANATQDLVYPVTIALSDTALNADGRRIALSPGMTVNAEIRTGSRRILDYLFSPIIESGSQALHER